MANPRSATWSSRQGRLGPVLMVLPAVLLLLAIVIFPLLYSLRLSVTSYDINPTIPRTFVGLENYASVLRDPRFLGSLRTTAIIAGAAIVIEFVLGLALAVVLSGRLIRGKRFIVPLLILPLMVPPVVAGFSWKLLWQPRFGPINQVLGWFAGRPVEIEWLSQAQTAIPAIIITDVWQWTPFMFLILLAGLSALNPELLEAAELDGAGQLRRLFSIIIPVIRPVILVAVLFRALDAIRLFDIIYTLTEGGPGYTTETVAFMLYLRGFKFFDLSFAAAASYLLLVIVTIVTTILLRRIREQVT
jgi:multiple sugar transport system permease protein